MRFRRWILGAGAGLLFFAECAGCGGGTAVAGIGDPAGSQRDAVMANHDGGAPADLRPGSADLATGPGSDGSSASGPYFPSGAPYAKDISAAPLDGQSAATLAWLQNAGGWGTGTMRIDFSITVLQSDESTPFRAFDQTDDFFSPDCDFLPMPLPPGGALEGEVGYQCLGGGDCHLIVNDAPSRKLYEMWRADLSGNSFRGGCLVVWDLTRVYPPSGRGEQCTSADGGGFPIAPLLFTADEVAAGSIDHAIRFVLPNERIQKHVYVHPGTHSTSSTSGPDAAPPYGARLRLRASYPLQQLPSDAARTVARALQRYGMFLADGGDIALTAESDRTTKAKWGGLLGGDDLGQLEVSDFEMVEAGQRFAFTGDCVRNP